MRPLTLYLPVDAFTPCGDDFLRPDGRPFPAASRLISILEISGVSHHLELIEVEERDGEQHTVIPDLDHLLDAAFQISGATTFETVDYNTRTYIVLVTPFGA